MSIKLKRKKARAKVFIALRNGSLIKPNNCANCGRKKELNAHHNNYDKPLEVVWLCDSCHSLLHKDSLLHKNNFNFRELGKLGAKKHWASRYELLAKLAGYTDKATQNKILKWPTKALEILLEVYEKDTK